MKNKRLTWILLPIVAVVWGLVIYRIVSSVGSSDATEPTPNAMKAHASNPLKKDTIYLLANYRDPFLNKSNHSLNQAIITVSNVHSNSPKIALPETKPTEAMAWPTLEYLGSIENKQSGNRIALVKIEGKEHLLKEKETNQQLIVEQIWKDSIQVSLQKCVKNFKKKL